MEFSPGEPIQRILKYFSYKTGFDILCKFITKTCLYNFDPHKPHFYIVTGFTGVYVIFLIFAQILDRGYSLEPPHIRNMKNIRVFYRKIFSFWR